MSYDLFVFDPNAAPRDRAAFKKWFNEQVKRGQDNPARSAACLQSWYASMLPVWPNMQEIDDDQVDDPHVTGYSCTPHSIYIDFRWSVAEEAYEATRSNAVKCEVGFYDVSGDNGDGEIYFPGDALREQSDGNWREVAADFRSGDVSKYIPEHFLKDAPPKRRWFDFFRRDK
jgi:hypothetical protein